jgi:molecular chaperone GrpE
MAKPHDEPAPGAPEPQSPPPPAGEVPAPEAPPAPPSEEEIAALREAAADRDRLRERLQRAYADYENYRKRMAKQRQEWELDGVRKLAGEMLSVADHLDLALANAEQTADPEKVLAGVRIVRDELHKVLGDNGVEPIEAEGASFDPAYHEAVMQDITVEHPPGIVTGEMRRGYTLKERVLRASRVKVSAAPPTPPAPPEAGPDADGGTALPGRG